MRRSRHSASMDFTGQIVEAFSIRDGKRRRKKKTRAIPGPYWKAICWPEDKNSYIATMVERHSRFSLPDHRCGAKIRAGGVWRRLGNTFVTLPATLGAASDPGIFAGWRWPRTGSGLRVSHEVQVNYAITNSPWHVERMKIDTNCLLRQSHTRNDPSATLKSSSNRSELSLKPTPRKNSRLPNPASKSQARCCVDHLDGGQRAAVTGKSGVL